MQQSQKERKKQKQAKSMFSSNMPYIITKLVVTVPQMSLSVWNDGFYLSMWLCIERSGQKLLFFYL